MTGGRNADTGENLKSIIHLLLDIATVVLRTGKHVTFMMANSVKDAEMRLIDLQVGCIARRHLQSGVPGAPLLPCSAYWLDAFPLVQSFQSLSSKVPLPESLKMHLPEEVQGTIRASCH